eukprot:scaffold137614_cov21-Tisochrysis_lutea.AAC.1
MTGMLCPSPLRPSPSTAAVLWHQQDRTYRPSLCTPASASRLPSIASLSDSETEHWTEVLSKITKVQNWIIDWLLSFKPRPLPPFSSCLLSNHL